MYVNDQIIAEVIDLFKTNKKMRDDKWGTIVLVWSKLKYNWNVYDEVLSIKLAFNVDRAFRWVQQEYPELRGDTWLKRQKQGGEYHGEYDIENEIQKVRQLKLFDDHQNSPDDASKEK